MKTKQEVLEENGFESITGYLFEYSNEGYNNIIISKEEILERIKQEAKRYYIKPNYNDYVDEETAWRNLYNDWCGLLSKLSVDITLEKWSEMMLK